MLKSIDYEKYENMSKKNLSNALLSAEKKLYEMSENLKMQKEFVKFLRTKAKKISKKELSIPALDEAIREFETGDIIKCENFAQYQAKMRN